MARVAAADYDITNTVYVNYRNSQGVAQPLLTSSTTFTVTEPGEPVPPPPAPNTVVVSIFDTSGRLIRTIVVTTAAEGITVSSAGNGQGGTALAGGAGIRIVLSDGTVVVWDGRDAGGLPVPSGLYTVRVSDSNPDGRETVSTATVAVTRPYERVIEAGVVVPNPADEAVWIGFRLADTTGRVEIKIYNIAAELVFSVDAPGTARSYRWDLRNRQGSRVAAGLYVVVVEAAGAMGGRKDRMIMKLAVEDGR